MSRFPSSINFTVNTTPNRTVGNFNKTSITLHWWDDPAKRPQWGGVMSWLHNRSAQVSATYMTEAGRISQLVPEKDVSWHSGHNTGNRHSIGIEVNPRLNAGDYETTAQLVAEIWRRYGSQLPLHPHRYWNSSTACPGHMDINRIRRRAQQINTGSSSTPAPSAPVLEGEVMPWSFRGLDYVNDNASTKNAQLARAHEYAWRIWGRIRDNEWADWLAGRVLNLRNGESGVSHSRHIRRGDFRYRGLDYVNENPSTKDAQLARAHQYAMQARNEVREVKAMVKAMAKAQDELLQGQGAILKAVEDAEVQVIQANAADVAAELEVTVKNDQEED